MTRDVMGGKGQLLMSAILVFFLHAHAHNSGTHANSGADTSDAHQRAMSSVTSSQGSSGRSSGAWESGARSALDRSHITLSPALAPAAAALLSPVLGSYTHKPSLQSGISGSPTIAINPLYSDPQSSRDLEDELSLASESLEEEIQEDDQQRNARVKRGSYYNAPYFVGKKSDEQSDPENDEDAQKEDASDDNLIEVLPVLHTELDVLDDTSDTSEDKRAAPMFVGKRRAPYFVGKRTAPYFVGKRRAPYFVGKRRAPYFVGKRMAPYFVGKRRAPYFVGKRRAPFFIGKRLSPSIAERAAPMFVGRRQAHVPLFVGKRQAPMFVGKRAAAPMFVGKRSAPMFVGKREGDNLNQLLAALHTLQAARHYRRMIQTDKRHNAPFFVGRRSSPQSELTDTADDNKLELLR